MSFVGKLDRFRLPDLMQIISANGKTGRLSLTRRDSQGVIVFRRGKIIYAASTSARETLGSLLLCRQLIDEQQLAEALEIQHQASEVKRLGTILVETGALSDEALREVVNQQIAGVITEFLEWDRGFFKFDLMELPDHGEIGADAQDFVHRDGLSPDKVLLDISERIEALEREHAAEPPPARAARPAAPPAAAAAPRLDSLKSIMGEVRSPEFTGEATGKILAFARQTLARGALFLLRRDRFAAISAFGPALPGGGKEAAGRLSLPLDEPSILAEAADRKEGYRGPLDETPANRQLVDHLGGGKPSEALAVPLVVDDSVLLVLYGDNAADRRPIAGFDQLELLMLQAGLAMERNLLRKRLEVVERHRAR